MVRKVYTDIGQPNGQIAVDMCSFLDWTFKVFLLGENSFYLKAGSCLLLQKARDSTCGSAVKNPPAKQEMWVQSLGREDSLKTEMATHSSIPVWRIPWTEKSGGLVYRVAKESDMTEWLKQQQITGTERLHIFSFSCSGRQGYKHVLGLINPAWDSKTPASNANQGYISNYSQLWSQESVLVICSRSQTQLFVWSDLDCVLVCWFLLFSAHFLHLILLPSCRYVRY